MVPNPIKVDDLGGYIHPYFWFNTHGGEASALHLFGGRFGSEIPMRLLARDG